MTITIPTTTTEDVIRAMLTENTGSHFLDSGGAYGRNWERNQSVDFGADVPPTTLSFEFGGISVTHDLYHFLVDTLEYDPDLDAAFQLYADQPENADEGWLTLMETFPGLHFTEADDRRQFVVNTYNNEDSLSQTIQYIGIFVEGDEYVLLQIHGGCDVRGGYTRPRAFRVWDDSLATFWQNASATIWCAGAHPPQNTQFAGLEHTPPQHWWTADDGCNFEPVDGGPYSPPAAPLKQFEIRYLDLLEQPTPGEICVDMAGKGYCPICAAPLSAGY